MTDRPVLRRSPTPGVPPAWTAPAPPAEQIADRFPTGWPYGTTPEPAISAAHARRLAADPAFRVFDDPDAAEIIVSAREVRQRPEVVTLLGDDAYRDEIAYTRPATPDAAARSEQTLLADLDALRVRGLDRVIDLLDTLGQHDAEAQADLAADLRADALTALGLGAEE